MEFISRKKIRQQLYFIYMLAVFVPIAVIGSFLLANTSRLLTDYYEKLLESDNLRVKTILFEITSQIYNISENISFDDEVQRILSTDDALAARTGTTAVDSYMYNHAEIEDITIYTDNVTASNYSHFELVDEEVLASEWYQKALGQATVFWRPMYREDKFSNPHEELSLIRRITVVGSKHEAVLVIRLSDNYLQSRIRSDEYLITLTNDQGLVCYSSTRTGYGEEQGEDYIDYSDPYYQYLGPVFVDADRLFTKVSTLQLYQSESRLYVTTMNESAYNDIYSILIACFAIILVAVLVPVLLIHYFTSYFTDRVTTLRNEMKKVTNEEYDIEMSFGGDDELSETFDDLQVMIRKIKEKDARMYETRLSEQQLLNEQQVMEMKMLASQINPHFLYNTLESIRMQALAAGNKEVANSIKLLGKSMRYVLENTGTSMVTLQKELDYMDTYLQIQKLRFGERVDYRIDKPEDLDLENYMLLPLLLQPIVENAILHGLEQVDTGGMILIDISVPEEEYLRIAIADNGCGMNPEELEKLQSMMAQRTIDRSNSIGICNINRRIRLCYGPDFGMDIESEPGKGTNIVVRLPIKHPQQN